MSIINILHVLEAFSPNALAIVGDFLGKERWEDLKKKMKPRFSSRSRNALRCSVMRKAAKCQHVFLSWMMLL